MTEDSAAGYFKIEDVEHQAEQFAVMALPKRFFQAGVCLSQFINELHVFLCRYRLPVFRKDHSGSQLFPQSEFIAFQLPFITSRQFATFFFHPAQTFDLTYQLIQGKGGCGWLFFLFILFVLCPKAVNNMPICICRRRHRNRFRYCKYKKPGKTNLPGFVFVCFCSSQSLNRRTLFHYFNINTDSLFAHRGVIGRRSCIVGLTALSNLLIL